jgi:hypothetical protein
VGLILRHVLVLRNLVITAEAAFVVFTIYGLAFSLISSGSRVIRRRDTVILILAATIIWGIFVEQQKALGMIRFMTFATLMTVGVSLARSVSSTLGRVARVGIGAALPMVLCGAGGLIYCSLVGWLRPGVVDVGRGPVFGLSLGLALGLAVGLGVAVGSEVVEWIAGKAD